MKRFSAIALAILFIALSSSQQAYIAYASSQEHDNESIVISATDFMTFEEMVQYCAEQHDISYQEALSKFNVPTNRARRASDVYRVFCVEIDVTNSYKPVLEFYCEVSKGDGVWGIMNIYSVQLDRSPSSFLGEAKQFQGEIQVWLRGVYEIEYLINGDFYNNGTTTVSGGTDISAGIDDLISVSFSLGYTSESSWYEYCYQHDTVSFEGWNV